VRWGLLAVILVVLAAPACSRAAGCTGLSGTFSVVPGSAGAGNITYALRLHNRGTTACLLRGLPQLRLLGTGGRPLPTKIVADPRFHAKPFLLRPGRTTTAMARFTPDVPGPGEQSPGPCEPVAHTARVLAAGLSIVVPLRPATRVCVSGRLSFTPYR
jgi:Domain of unknown function (DUF4232)